MTWIEWSIILLFLFSLIALSLYTKRYIKGVSDWLVAGRGVGRYLGATAGEAASMGAISIIAGLQASYVGGPVYWWTIIIMMVVYIIISVSGWGIYRLRQTKVMTLNELLERRYSRKLRIFCGILCFISGILNMGIFPIVSGRFIVYFCQLPEYFDLFGLTISSVFVITALCVVISVVLGLFGGQISLVLTDFVQWTVMMVMFIAVGIAVYLVVDWDHIAVALNSTPQPKQYLDPFLPTSANDFGLWYCAMFAFRAFYNILSWAPGSGKGQTASDPREAKLMWILSYVRSGKIIGLLYAAVACFAFMQLPAFTAKANEISASLGMVDNEMVRTQMLVPVFLAHILPAGLKGLFVAGMIAATLGTIGTYFLTWASVFAQDVYIPLGRKTYSTQQHLKLLRWSVIGVAVFVFFFSIFWRETEYINMYFAITGSIYTGGAGAVILGALYWRRATTAGAWAAIMTGSAGSIFGIIARQVWGTASWWPNWLNGMSISVIASFLAIAAFLLISLMSRKQLFDLDTLLNRKQDTHRPQRYAFETIFGVLAFAALGLIIFMFVYGQIYTISTSTWITFYKWCSYIFFGYSIPVALWFMIGSIIDVKNLFKTLHSEKIDQHDDGQIRHAASSKKRSNTDSILSRD